MPSVSGLLALNSVIAVLASRKAWVQQLARALLAEVVVDVGGDPLDRQRRRQLARVVPDPCRRTRPRGSSRDRHPPGSEIASSLCSRDIPVSHAPAHLHLEVARVERALEERCTVSRGGCEREVRRSWHLGAAGSSHDRGRRASEAGAHRSSAARAGEVGRDFGLEIRVEQRGSNPDLCIANAPPLPAELLPRRTWRPGKLTEVTS